MLVVEEARVDALELAGPFDVDLVRAVDHDLGDGLVLEERLDRAEAGDVVDHLVHELLALLAGDRQVALFDHPVDDPLHLGGDVLGLRIHEVAERGDDLALEPQPDVPDLLAAPGPARGWAGAAGATGTRALSDGSPGPRCARSTRFSSDIDSSSPRGDRRSIPRLPPA